MRTVCSCALIALVLLPAAASAQQPPNDLEKLRLQLQVLNAQLAALEGGGAQAAAAPIGAPKIAEIGANTSARGREPQMIVRFYDVSDLFAVAPPYPATYAMDLGTPPTPLFPALMAQYSTPGLNGAMGGGGQFGTAGGLQGTGGMGGGGFFSVPPTQGAKLVPPPPHALYQVGDGDQRTSIDDLLEAITKTISPDSWDEVGGRQSISRVGTALLINADERSHEQIANLITLFRKRWGTLRTISVQAWWLWLSDAQLATLVGDVKDAPTWGVAEPKAWQQLQDQLQAADFKGPAGFRAAVTSYNGQTVHTATGGQTLLVTDINPQVVPGNEKRDPLVAYQPRLTSLEEGAALQITPVANTSGKIVVMDVHSRVARIADTRAPQADKPAAEKPGEAAVAKGAEIGPQQLIAALDRPRVLTQRLSTTLRLPVGRPMLVGGMTFEGQPTPNTLYLFVKAAVQELRDDEKDK